MTEQKWREFAGALYNCNSNCGKSNCPLFSFRNLDNVNKGSLVRRIGEDEVKQIIELKVCNSK